MLDKTVQLFHIETIHTDIIHYSYCTGIIIGKVTRFCLCHIEHTNSYVALPINWSAFLKYHLKRLHDEPITVKLRDSTLKILKFFYATGVGKKYGVIF